MRIHLPRAIFYPSFPRHRFLLPILVPHQVENGAQVIQYFESWAHHLSPPQFEEFAKPYANKVTNEAQEAPTNRTQAHKG